MLQIALVTVNYNNAAATQTMLRTLHAYGRKYLSRVIVVDNASNTEDFERVRSCVDENVAKGLRVELVRNSENLGYFRGLNSGLELLLSRPEKLIVCNNDLCFAPEFFDRLANRKWDEDVLVVAPNVSTPDGVRQNPHAVRPLPWLRKFSYSIYFSNYWLGAWLLQMKRWLSKPRSPAFGNPCDIYMGVGACYVLTSEFFARCHRLDDRIFLWGEEALIAHQVVKAGGRMRYDPELCVTHNRSATTRLLPRRQQYQMAKASYRIYKHYL